MGKTNPYKNGFWLGVLANPSPSYDSYNDPTATMWCSDKGRVVVNGQERALDDWVGFEQGDEVTFKLEPVTRVLSMCVSRFPLRWFVLGTGLSATAGVYPHVSLVSQGK